ncbi:hypothetical protein AAFF_G00308390 [Aldrovandia affinis]|uniref:Ig-like domain-containing protein n=1 Tax=Aldrovandia affinis TaxID=143900 RepID=A0AAD7SQJ4_9TELE|nr:hypothetical protein AAFF_G00308390 [Aldrovandia affinis]
MCLTGHSLRRSRVNPWTSCSMCVVWIALASALLPVCVQVTVHAVVGQDVLLPCACPPRPLKHSAEHFLVWQIGQHTVVNYAIPNQENVKIPEQYLNRTRLFYPADRENCSLLLRRVGVLDEKTYSCLYRNPGVSNVTVSLEVSAPYSSVQCSKNSTGEGYECRASGGFPKGRIYWLQNDLNLEGPQSELHSQDHLTSLYNLTSTLTRTRGETATLECRVVNPRLPSTLSALCTDAGPRSNETHVGTKVKTSVAVGSVLLVLAAIFLFVFIKFWKPCPTSLVPGPRYHEQTQQLNV